MKVIFLAKGVGEIGCALGKDRLCIGWREQRVDNFGCLLREANEKKFSFRWIKS